MNPYVMRITREGPVGVARYQISDDDGESWSKDKTLLPDIELINEEGKSSDKVMMYALNGKITKITIKERRPDGNWHEYEAESYDVVKQPVNNPAQ